MKIVEVMFTRDGAKIVTFTRNQYNELEKELHNFYHYFYVKDENGEHKTLFGERVRKRNVRKFWLAKQHQKEYDEVFEGDISFTKRFMVDKAHEIESHGEPRVLFFDIETTSFTPSDGEVLSIVAYDSYARKYYELMWHPELECDSERKLLIEFAKVVKNVDPDIITGWNSDRFDIPFIYERMETLQVPTELLSRLGQKIKPFHNGERMEYRIRGRINIDYLKAYKKMVIKEMDSYSLEYVAKTELGAGKIDIGKLPGKLWEEKDFDALLRYNRRDVEIMVELDKKLEIIKFLNSVSDLASIDFHDTLFNSRIVDSYILRYTSSKGIVLPTRTYTNKQRGYTGAKVLDPKKGIHDNVGIFDLASLYPSIIISFNLSPETMQTEHGIREQNGLVPILLEDLFTLRREYRDNGQDREQKVVKTIMNSFYGVMALPTFRLYTHAMASKITEHGRNIIEHTKSVVEDMGYTVVYGDTDSVFVSGINDTNAARDLESAINAKYDIYVSDFGIKEHRLQIEFEAFAPRALMVKKKRYAMKLDNGKYKIAGFQLKRSDTQPLARRLQEQLLHFILEGQSKKEVYEWFMKCKSEALNGKADTELGIPRKFNKDLDEYSNGYAVDGAIYSNRYFNRNYGAGDKCVIYHVDRVFNAKPTLSLALDYEEEIPKEYLIDRKKHWSRVEKAIMPLLVDADCLEKTKQKTLGDFL